MTDKWRCKQMQPPTATPTHKTAETAPAKHAEARKAPIWGTTKKTRVRTGPHRQPLNRAQKVTPKAEPRAAPAGTYDHTSHKTPKRHHKKRPTAKQSGAPQNKPATKYTSQKETPSRNGTRAPPNNIGPKGTSWTPDPDGGGKQQSDSGTKPPHVGPYWRTG